VAAAGSGGAAPDLLKSSRPLHPPARFDRSNEEDIVQIRDFGASTAVRIQRWDGLRCWSRCQRVPRRAERWEPVGRKWLRWIQTALVAGLAFGVSGCGWSLGGAPPHAKVPPFPAAPHVLAGEELPTVWPGPAPTPLPLRQVVVLSPQRYWGVITTASPGSAVVKTTTGGQHWQEHYRTGLPVTALVFVTSLRGYALENGCRVGLCGTSALLETRDGGKRWFTAYATHRRRLDAVSFVTGEWGYRVAGGGRAPLTLAFTVDGGANWSPRVMPCADGADASARVSFATRTVGYVACQGTATGGEERLVVWATRDGGWVWHQVGASLTLPGRLTGLSMLSESRGYLGTTRGLLVTTNGGRTWGPAAHPLMLGRSAITSLGALGHRAFLIAAGRVWTTTRRLQWTALYPPPRPETALAWPTLDRQYGLGSTGAATAVLTSRDGVSWRTVGYVPKLAASLVAASPQVVWAIKPGMFISRDGGRQWQAANLPAGVVVRDAAACGRDGFLLTANDAVWATRTQGRTFVDRHVLPFDATGVSCQVPGVGFAVGRPRAADARHLDPSQVYLWRTVNNGRSWTPYTLPPVLNLLPPATVRFLGVRLGWMWSANGYWVTSNGGRSWVVRTVPRGVVIRSLAFYTPLRALMVTNTGVYVSTTGGLRWTFTS